MYFPPPDSLAEHLSSEPSRMIDGDDIKPRVNDVRIDTDNRDLHPETSPDQQHAILAAARWMQQGSLTPGDGIDNRTFHPNNVGAGAIMPREEQKLNLASTRLVGSGLRINSAISQVRATERENSSSETRN